MRDFDDVEAAADDFEEAEDNAEEVRFSFVDMCEHISFVCIQRSRMSWSLLSSKPKGCSQWTDLSLGKCFPCIITDIIQAMTLCVPLFVAVVPLIPWLR